MGTAGTLGLFTVHSWYFGAFQRAQLALRGFSEGTAGTLEVLQRAQLALWRLLRGHSWHPGCFTEGTAGTLGFFTEGTAGTLGVFTEGTNFGSFSEGTAGTGDFCSQFTAVIFTGFCLTRFKR